MGMWRSSSDTWTGVDVACGGSMAELSRQQSTSSSCPLPFKFWLLDNVTVAPNAVRATILSIAIENDTPRDDDDDDDAEMHK